MGDETIVVLGMSRAVASAARSKLAQRDRRDAVEAPEAEPGSWKVSGAACYRPGLQRSNFLVDQPDWPP